MDINKINLALLKGIRVLDAGEKRALAEMAYDEVGDIEAEAPVEPFEPDVGEEELSEAAIRFEDFVAEVAEAVMDETGVDFDVAVDAVFAAADALVAEGKIPEIPDEYEDLERVEEWIRAAEAADLVSKAVEVASVGDEEESYIEDVIS